MGSGAGGVIPAGPHGPGGLAEGRGPIRGRAILERLATRGVTLSVRHGRLLATAPGGKLTSDVADLVAKAEPLLAGYVLGAPLACQLGHGREAAPEAVTILLGGLAACEAHRSGELGL